MNPNPSSPPDHPVQHNVAAHRFEITTDGLTSLLDYEPAPGGIVVTHTYVPPELRGRGLAEQLVRAALGWAREQKHHVTPQCSYVAVFMERHREYQDLLERR